MNTKIFFTIVLIFTCMAGALLWTVMSINEAPRLNRSTSVDADAVADLQPTEGGAQAQPPVEAEGMPGIALNAVVESLTDEKAGKLIYGPLYEKFILNGKVLASADYLHGEETKHVYVSTLDTRVAYGHCSFFVFKKSGESWLVESKAVIPYRKGMSARWRRIGKQNWGLVCRFKRSTAEGMTVENSVYTISGQIAQCVLNTKVSGKPGQVVDQRIAFRRTKKAIWGAYVASIVDKEEPVLKHYVYRYGSFIDTGVVPPLTVEQIWKTRGLPSTKTTEDSTPDDHTYDPGSD